MNSSWHTNIVQKSIDDVASKYVMGTKCLAKDLSEQRTWKTMKSIKHRNVVNVNSKKKNHVAMKNILEIVTMNVDVKKSVKNVKVKNWQ